MAPKAPIGSLREQADALRGQSSTTAKRSFATLPKTAQIVEDSSSSDDSDDDSSDESEEKLAAMKKKLETGQSAKKMPTKSPKVNGTKEAKTSAKPERAAPADDSSSSESESEAEAAPASKSAKSVTTKTNATSSKAETTTTSDSESDSDDEDEDDDDDEEAGAKINPPASAKTDEASKPTEDDESSDEVEDDDEDDEDEEEVDEQDGPTEAAVQSGKSSSDPAVAQKSNGEIARPAWLDNTDFTIRKASTENPGKDVAEFLSKTKLDGKQVWYFTAPASLPITVLKDMEIDLAKAQAGGVLFNHGGDAYGLDLEPYATSTQVSILLANKQGDRYTTLDRGIDTTIHVSKRAEFGGESKVSATATDDYIRQPKPVRQQPENLRPRFTPIGVPTPKIAQPTRAKPVGPVVLKANPGVDSEESDDDDDEDEEMLDAPVIPISKPVNGGVKRKQAVEDESDDDEEDESDDDTDDPPPLPAKSPAPSTQPAKRPKVTSVPAPKPSQGIKKSMPAPASSPAIKTTQAKATPQKISASQPVAAAKPLAKQTPVPVPKYGQQ